MKIDILVLLLSSFFVWEPTFIHAQSVNTGDVYNCQFTSTRIEIDGRANETPWLHAPTVGQFVWPWEPHGSNRRAETSARLLWDREFLYVFAEMSDKDILAVSREHDGQTWLDDVLEMFFKPDESSPAYYEFHVTAAGTELDMFIPRRNPKAWSLYASEGDFSFKSQVLISGSLNNSDDLDSGWCVEARIPWRDFAQTGGRPNANEVWSFALSRYDYSSSWGSPSLSSSARLSEQKPPSFHRHEEFPKIKFLAPASDDFSAGSINEIRSSITDLNCKVSGTPEPRPDYRASRILPEMRVSWPICVRTVPGSKRLIFIDQTKPFGPSSIRTYMPGKNGEIEKLYDFPNGGVGYSITFHPKFEHNKFLYVGWNGTREATNKRTTVTRFTVIDDGGFRLDEESGVDIISWPSDGHNGGAVVFDNGGKLLVTSGDGTKDSDIDLRGQGLDHLLAKVLRLDVNKHDSSSNYSIPPDNPFVGHTGARPETWAYGLRNPWRISVDRRTGDVWVGNNGQDSWEQVYKIQSGANYGWSAFEGSHPFYPNRKLGPSPHVLPTVEHSHAESRSLTGGVVYYGQKFPDLNGAYIYGDYSTGKIWGVKMPKGKIIWQRELADTSLQITDIAEDQNGELVIADHQGNGNGGFYTLELQPKSSTQSRFPRRLSETGLFEEGKSHSPNPALIPYSVNSPLWSDGAIKTRYVALPPTNAEIRYSKQQSWEFPDGTVLVKSFAIESREGDPSTSRWLETRLLHKEQGEWAGYSYKWRQDQTDADLVEASGDSTTVHSTTTNGTQKSQRWVFPSRADCMVCHTRASKFVLGFSTNQLNRDQKYGLENLNQLEAFEKIGIVRVKRSRVSKLDSPHHASVSKADSNSIREAAVRRQASETVLLETPPNKLERLVNPRDERADISLRVRSYLHANCANCHIFAGGGNSKMQLDFATPLERMAIVDHTPLHNGFGLSRPKLIRPGSPENSVLLYRLSLRGRSQMPPLGSSVIDDAAVELFNSWIESLRPKPGIADN